MNKKLGGLVALAAGLIVATSGHSEAGLRYRSDAHECFPQTAGIYVDAGGLHMSNGAAGGVGVGCSVPTGAGLVDLGDGLGHTLQRVAVRLHQTTSTATLQTLIRVRDYDSGSRCTCGSTEGDASNSYVYRNMPFDCGACSYGSDWTLNVGVFATGSVGTTTLKAISVYD